MNFISASDRSLLVNYGSEISIEVNSHIHSVANQMNMVDGVTSVSPAYASLLIRFDPLTLTHEMLAQIVSDLEDSAISLELPRIVEIPVHYDGPDLDSVANDRGLTRAQVIEAHSSTLYHAYFAGFVPGFVYLGEVPASIASPRKATPRAVVPAGSVGIAGTQTGVYPVATPGGWNLIGRTTSQMFDSSCGKALIDPGDKVRFVPH